MTTLNKITGVVTGEYGTARTLTVVDDDGNVVDLSAFTTVVVRAMSPDAATTLSFTGSLVSSGVNGQLTFTPSSGNTFTRDGTWEGQIQLGDTGVLNLTVPFQFIVEKQI